MSCFRMVLAASFGNTYNVTCIIMTYGRMAVWRHRDSEGIESLSFYVCMASSPHPKHYCWPTINKKAAFKSFLRSTENRDAVCM